MKNTITEYEYNMFCPCLACSGKGLGWIKHLTLEQSMERLDRLAREREKNADHQYLDTGYKEE